MLEALGNAGDFIGGLAVIVTLIYLAAQIRQNTQMLRRTTEESVSSGAATTIGLPAQSPENAAVFYRGLVDPDTMPPGERTHFYLLIANLFVVFDEAHEAHADGLLSDHRWTRQRNAMRVYAAFPGVRSWWNFAGRSTFGPDSEFSRLVESELQRNEPAG